MNKVTLFSNGIGHFERSYSIAAGSSQKISIPFNKEHISDVATSLNIFGDVKYVTPPSFTPNNISGSSLTIDPNNAFCSLVRALSGSKVRVEKNGTKSTYTLLGLETRDHAANGALEKKQVIVLLNDDGIQYIGLDAIQNIFFLDETIQSEINKALSHNFQKIKPESTFLDLELENKNTSTSESFVTYTIPVAAWKMRYSLRQTGKTFCLEGSVIVDNNTDEDWDNFVVSVVTGNPMSFQTDMADIIVPARRFVNLSDTNNQSYIEPVAAKNINTANSNAGASLSKNMQFCNMKLSRVSYSNESADDLETNDDIMQFAEADGVDTKEIGDFCVFTAKNPITILSKKSAIVPMFNLTLDNAKVVLLYEQKNHSSRPYRTIKFKNTTSHTLGRGKVVVYNDGIFSGECVLDTTKINENRMLPHCLENSVKITATDPDLKETRTKVNISKNVVVQTLVKTCDTVYQVDNKRDEEFDLAIHHNNILSGKVDLTFNDGIKEEKLDGSSRLYIKLKPSEKITIRVSEKVIVDNNVDITDTNFSWFQTSILSTTDSLKENEVISKCVELQKEIDKVSLEINDMINQIRKNVERSERMRKNITSTSGIHNNPKIASWVNDLATIEDTIVEFQDKKIPEKEKSLVELKQRLNDQIAKITIDCNC